MILTPSIIQIIYTYMVGVNDVSQGRENQHEFLRHLPFFFYYEVTHFGAYRGLVNNGDVKSFCNWMTIPRVHPKVNLSLIGNTKKYLLAFSL